MATSNDQILAYLRSLGVDPGIFGNVSQNDLQYAKWGDTSGGMGDYAQYGFTPTTRDAYLAGIQDPTKTGEYRLSDGQFSTAGGNYGLMVNPDGSFTRRVKVGDKESVEVPYVQQPDGSWAPNWDAAQQGSWDTNRGLKQDLRGMATVLGAAAGGYAANSAGLFGGAAGEAGAAGSAAANPYALGAADFASASAPASAWGTTGAGYIPGSYAASPFAGAVAGEGGAATLGGMMPGMAAIPGTEAAMGTAGAGGTGIKWPTSAGEWGDWLTKIGGAAGAMPGSSGAQSGSSMGGLLGGLLGAGAGYLDARNQPNELRVKQEIDPALHDIIYGPNNSGGFAQNAYNLLQQQNGQPNPLTEAGKQISGMANTLPGYNDAVNNNKALWDSNPWVQDQQKAITDLTTRNLMENVLPGVNSGAMAAGSYGGSRQGIAQAKSISDMNTNLAPALSNLASNAWESSQNRALSGAGTQLNYGLANQQQQAGLLGTGANLQANGPWSNYNQMSNLLSRLPGNNSTVNPLFTNTAGNMLGGAQLGSQVGGGTNWEEIFKSIGGIAGLFK